MDYVIRQAETFDFDRILDIYAGARDFMAQSGNASQWGITYPEVELTEADMADGVLYVITNRDIIHGVFALIPGADPTYREIMGGAWHYDLPYAAIHRVAGDGSGGIVSALVSYALDRYGYLRIDTHEKNLPMQRAVERAGFLYCGIIITMDGTPRLAYDLKK